MDSHNLEPSSSKKFPVITKDGVRFEVNSEVAMKLKTPISCIEEDDNGEPSVIHLPYVSSDSFVKIADNLHFEEMARLFEDENENREKVSGCEKFGVYEEEVRSYRREFLEKLDDDAVSELWISLLLPQNLMMEEFYDLVMNEFFVRIVNVYFNRRVNLVYESK